jgi:D-beta-D-heptose 7-phosphate kinase/D-beta-D-heptose 1-phosphate adenosyltransferase
MMTQTDLGNVFAGRRVLVFGDVMLDRYCAGAAQRISPEAPVPVVRVQHEWDSPGGAANVAASLAALGADVTCAGVVGNDPAGGALRQRLAERGVRTLILAETDGNPTITKTRVIANHQQLARLDVDGESGPRGHAAEPLARTLQERLRDFQAVCLADYDKGTLSPSVLAAVIGACRQASIPCLVDPKKHDFAVYSGATLLTPNLLETERAVGHPLNGEAAVTEAAVALRERLGLDAMLVTRGEAGMTLASADDVTHIRAEVREVADVTGAGDTVVAVLGGCLAAGWRLPEACRLASVAAGIAVSRAGVHVVTLAELEQAWQGVSPKILAPDAARHRLAAARRAGKRIVFTNGCFDILHAGHLYCLEQARRLGDLLVVGLNSDHSVRLNKESSRPIIPEAQRAALLAGLACVDLVVLFDELTPADLVRHLEPDVLVKGGDYAPDAIAGADFVRERGGVVTTIPLMPGLSTTAILGKLTTPQGSQTRPGA